MKKQYTRIKPSFLGLVIVLLFCFSFQLYPTVIKIGSVAPDRSPWGTALRELGQEWSKITNGEVTIKIFPGGIAGSETDVIRKMRMGILGGGVFTNRGFNAIYPDVYALNIPFMITSKDELDYVMDKMKPRIEKAVEEKGYKVVIFTMAGWLHFFSKNPVQYPEDMKKHKMAYTTGEPMMEQAWKKSGYHIVPLEMKDMMMGLQSGMADSFYLPPILAGSAQYFALAPYMFSLRLAPLVGGIILPKKVWDRIPEKYHAPMMKAAQQLSTNLYAKIVKLEEEAIETMKKHGLKIVESAPDSLPKWREAAAKGMDEVVGKAFSKEIYDEVMQHLKNYRAKHPDVK
jgi:TRAP-type C4-dicarboxylate transport system substrate-binding protein